MKQLSTNISKQFVTKKIISEEEIEVYQYGLEILFSSFFTSFSIIIIATILDSFSFGILYLCITIPLRITIGGYHAKTYMGCYLISNLSYITLSILLKLIVHYNIPLYICIIALYICTAYILQKAPIENPHHPLNQQCFNRNKKISTTILIILNLFVTLLAITCPTSKIIYFFILSILLVALFILPTQKGGTT